MANVAEHRVNMPAYMPAYPAAGKAASAPELGLNRFVRFVTLMERLGNALGTLAFTWATVVLLGGYLTVLGPGDDFWWAAAIVFLEALRMFSRSNRMDYQLFFRTRGAFRSLRWIGVILRICFFNVLMVVIWSNDTIPWIVTWSVVGLLVNGSSLCLEAEIPPMLRRMISLWSPMVAILMLCPSVWFSFHRHGSVANCTVYLVLFVVVLLLTISRLRFPRIIKLADWILGSKIAFWQRIVLNLCMFAATVMSAYNLIRRYNIYGLIIWDIPVLVITSFGNLQIPAALFRIGLALWRLIVIQKDYNDQKNLENRKNLLSSLYIFYAMVLGQGILYTVAGIFEIFSFILRRSLIHRVGFRGPSGVKYVNLYYAYAFDRCMEGPMLRPKKTSLIIFAMDSLKSNSPKIKLYGLKMLHSFLKKEPLRTMAILELTTYTKTVTCLINMLGWTSEEAKDIRSFAAKITAELAENLRVIPIPGAMQLIASLLDTVQGHNIKNPLFDTGSPETKGDNLIQQVGRNELTSPMLKWLKQMALYCLIPREEPTNMDEQNTHILRCWRKITKHWSVPEEEPSTDQDLLPVQGMLILERLATFHLENCIEISRATGLISKIVEFTSNRTDMNNIGESTNGTLLKRSSLKLMARLASTKGKFCVTLRQKITEHLFLWNHLAEILDNRGSSQELRELTAELVRNFAMDGNVNNEIGHIPMIISRLMHAFLSQGASSSADSDQLLRMNAGQALALLAMESVNNCLVMLAEPGYVFIKELTILIHSGRYRYIASSLLQNMCVHAQSELSNSDLKEISYITREVLEGIMDAEGTELEVLVGLSSQICNVIPGDFARELEHGQIKERFIKRIVNALNSNMIPTSHSPGIRRVIVEHVIYMMECNPGNANCFNKYWMTEALLMVERTASRAENYRLFSGDAGLMEHSVPLSALVSRAKELMCRR